MHSVNIHDAKTHLSKYVENVQHGQEIIICKSGHPVAILKAYQPQTVQRQLGGWKGKVKIHKDFDVLPDDFMDYFK